MVVKSKRKPGFQFAETSGARVVFYHHNDEPGFVGGIEKREFVGRYAGADAQRSELVRVRTSKSIGGGAGRFEIVLKLSPDFTYERFIADDDWVDIILYVNDRSYHVMRGLVDRVLRPRSTNATGATTVEYTVVGRDFTKIWEDTEIWFNRFSGEDVMGTASMELSLANSTYFNAGVGQNPKPAGVPRTVEVFLYGFLQRLSSFGRANWELPAQLPVNADQNAFIDTVTFNTEGFSNEPSRLAFRPWFHPAGFQGERLWELATAWSDPQFCELFTDLWPTGEQQPGPGQESGEYLNENDMTVVLRDRPYPTETPGAEGPQTFESGPWWKLPLHELAPQEVRMDNMGRGGQERRNCFLFSPTSTPELAGNLVQLAAPLWSPTSIRRHGQRIMEVTSKYVADVADVVTMAESQRERIRDWFCLSHLFLSGNAELPNGRPDIKVGSRVRRLGEAGEQDDETFYCEGVSHHWQLLQGVHTSLVLTRGFRGADIDLVSALRSEKGNYKVAVAGTPEQEEGTDPES